MIAFASLLAAAVGIQQTTMSPPTLAPQIKPVEIKMGTIKTSRENIKDDDGQLQAATVTVEVVVIVNQVDESGQKVAETRCRPSRRARSFRINPIDGGSPTPKEDRKSLSDVMDKAAREGYAAEAGQAVYQGFLKAKEQKAKVLKEADPVNVDPNINIREGGWTGRTWETRVHRFDATVVFIKTVTFPGKESKPIVTRIESNVPLGTLKLPNKNPMASEVFAPDPMEVPPVTHSWISLGDLYETRTGMLQLGEENARKVDLQYVSIPRLSVDYKYQESDMTIDAGRYFNDVTSGWDFGRHLKLADTFGFGGRAAAVGYLGDLAAQGEDMNRFSIPGSLDMTPPNCGSRMIMPAGTVWMPDQRGYQTMMNIEPFDYSLGVSAIDSKGFVVPATVRTHCLAIDKKPPAAGVRYYPYQPADDRLVELAKIAERSRFRGPWDQARTWLFTNKASLAEINTRMSPPVSSGRYVNAIEDVLSVGGFDDRDLKNKEIFTPDLLLAVTARDAAFSWTANHLAENFTKETSKWLKSMPEDLVKLIQTPRNRFETEHPDRLFHVMLMSNQKEVRTAALELLDKMGDKASNLNGKIGSFKLNLNSADKKELELAQRVARRLAG